MKQPFFTIIIVCLNPAEKLKRSLDSIFLQTFKDYEIIIKDGLSKDGSLESFMEQNNHQNIRIFRERDLGIYDAMNKAVKEAAGQYVYFLNCGDELWDEYVLAKVQKYIYNDIVSTNQIYYGNIFEVLTGQEVYSNPQIDRFACYRNLPNHQTCFYQRDLLLEHPFDIQYKIRADHEHFIWSVLEKGAKTKFIPILVARYEGAGFSEAKQNRKISMREFKEITRKYMSKSEIIKYRLIMIVTLATLRSAMSRSKLFAPFYNRIKKRFYQ